MTNAKKLYDNEHDEIKNLLVGRRVVNVDPNSGLALLDNGTALCLKGSEGCGGCSSGWYDLTELNTVDNIITNVEFEDNPDDDYEGGSYKIFVFADNQRINFASFVGSDGNGYYGSGYSIEVRLP